MNFGRSETKNHDYKFSFVEAPYFFQLGTGLGRQAHPHPLRITSVNTE
jgi:hypothetical protein